MSTATRARRAGLVLGGIFFGTLLAAALLWFWYRWAQDAAIRSALRTELGLPAELFRPERIRADGMLVVSLREVALLDRAGDTVLVAPRIRLAVDPASFAGTGPVVVRDVVVPNPTLRLIQARDGSWNFAEVVGMEAEGREVDLAPDEPGRGVLLRNVRITGGRALLVTPAEAPDSAGAIPGRVRTAAGWLQRRTARDLDARLAEVRVGGPRGWRVEVARLSAQLANPELRVTALKGAFEQAGESGVRFAVDALRTPRSTLSGEGELAFGGESPQLEGTIRAAPLAFEDLQGLGITVLPPSGTAEFALRAESRLGGRTAWRFQELRLATFGSAASGTVTVLTGGGEPLAFGNTRLQLEPLRLATLERAGLVDSLPLAGEVRGLVTGTEGEAGAPAGALRLDLRAELRPQGEAGAEPSVLLLQGLVNAGAGESGVRLGGLRVQAEPLRLATLVPFAPEQADRLRGTLRGGVTLEGTPQQLRVTAGDLAFEVGDAPATRLTGIEADVALDPLRYRLAARAEPLALGTLTELFPQLPFRPATLAGPVRVSGSEGELRFDTSLDGPAGSVLLDGSLALGDPLRFEVRGELEAFRAGSVLASGVRVSDPLSGTFAAAGTPADFRINADLVQGAGAFALDGRVRLPEGAAPVLGVSGEVRDFRVGALLGRPGLLAGPVSGQILVDGGEEGAPLRFRTDLRGAAAAVNVAGWYLSGPVPRYAASGTLSGVSLRALPGFASAPAAPLTATLDVAGRGTTPETLEGRFNVSARTVGERGAPAQSLVLRALAENGVLRVDTLAAELFGARVRAGGALGLTRPAEAPLRFSLAAPELSRLAALLPPPGPLQPELAGSVTAQGFVTGTVRDPLFSATLRGRDLRYEGWTTGTLFVQATGASPADALRGRLVVAAEGARVPTVGDLASVRVEATLLPGGARFAAVARRTPEVAVAAGGAIDLPEGEFRAVALDSLALQLPGSVWRLDRPARIAYDDTAGLRVEGLALRETGGDGVLEAEGRLPFRGTADLRVRAAGVGLQQLRLLAPALPEAEGTLALDAVLRGPVTDPELRGALTVDSLVYGGVATDRVAVGVQYADGRLDADAAALLGGRQVLSAEAVVPLSLSLADATPAFQLLRTEPLRAQLVADSLPLQVIAAATPGLGQGAGIISADVLVGGTPASPEVSGVAGVSGGALFVDLLGVRYEGIEARVALAEERIRIDTLIARTGDGAASLSGTIGIANPERPEVYLRSTFRNFHAIARPDLADLDVSGALVLSGALPSATVSGRVTADEGTIRIPSFTEVEEIPIIAAEVGELGADTLSAPLAGFAGTPFGAFRFEDLQVAIGDAVYVENPDLRVQIEGNLDVYSAGTGELPRLFGVLRTPRGTYDLRIEQIVREFDVQGGSIEFFGTPEFNPGLDITAVNEVRSAGATGEVIDVLVRITGTVQQPEINLTSNTTPPLPESELLSYLIFGQPRTQLGGLTESLPQQLIFRELIGGQIAQGVEGLAERLGLGVFDYVRFRTDPTGFGSFGALASPEQAFAGTLGAFGGTLEAGKQLVENVFLTVELGVQQLFSGAGAASGPGNARATFGAAVIWEPTEQWTVRVAGEPVRQTLLSRIVDSNIDYQFLFDVRRRWEFGRAADERREEPARSAPDGKLPGEVSAGPGDPLPAEPDLPRS